MSLDLTGTNSERIDKLIVAFVDFRAEVRTMLRVAFWMTTVGIPLLVGLCVWLVTQSFGADARLEQNRVQLARVDNQVSKLEQLILSKSIIK